MKTQLLFIQRNPDRKEIAWIKEQYSPADTEILLENFIQPVKEFSDYDQKVFQLDDHVKRQINQESFDALLKFGDTIDSSKFSHAQIFQYQKMNLWYYNKFRAYYWLREGWYQRAKIKQLLEKYQNIVLLSSSDSHSFFLNLAGVDVIPASNKRKGSFSLKISYAFRFALRGLLNLFVRTNPANKFLLVSPSERVQPIMRLDDFKLENNDPFFAYLLSRYGRDIVLLDEMKVPEKSTDRYPGLFPSHHHKYFLGESVMFRSLFIPRIWKEWSIVNKKMKRILSRTISNELNEVNRALLIFLQTQQRSHSYYIFRYLAYRRFFKRKRIRAVLATDENSMFTKVILDAAKDVGVLTIGMQHGNIHSLHPAYMFTEKDRELHPMPDYTFVWGELWKKVLVEKGNYRDKELVVVGQLRTDIIPRLKDLEPQDKFTIVFASQPQTDEMLRRKSARDVFQAAKELDLKLRIKLHPREKDESYYREIATEVGIENYEFTGSEDLYQVIRKSGVMITCYSTVGAETAYFHKPLIILDYLKEDINGYVKDGIAFQASNLTEMKTLIKEIQNGKVIASESYEKYIQQCAYAVDGKVASRIMEWLRLWHPITSDSAE